MSYNSLHEAVTTLRGDVTVTSRLPLSGGDINRSYKVTLSDNYQLFVKENSSENLSFFETEFKGLQLIARTKSISAPQPLAYGIDRKNSFLILPFLEGKMNNSFYEDFGRQLALFHMRGRGTDFGLCFDNYIGATVQKNERRETWVDFFREMRLDYQIRLATPYIDGTLSRQLLKLLDRLENYLPEPDYPSLLHGDLWSGNYTVGPDGHPWLIDPAVYYGHPEADLAMTELFGGFSTDFYESYKENSSLEADYGERRDLYNLYHMLNHLNLFGLSYLESVKRIVSHYL